jgi:hypothetical protein
MYSERGIGRLAANPIVLRKKSSYIGALALNWDRPSAPNGDGKASKIRCECRPRQSVRNGRRSRQADAAGRYEAVMSALPASDNRCDA